jgi:hypothetical protein
MFSERSRYQGVPTREVKLRGGKVVTVVGFPARTLPVLAGYHQRNQEQRLDHLANFYLKDPAGFWRLCDANDGISPHALNARELIAIPRKER